MTQNKQKKLNIFVFLALFMYMPGSAEAKEKKLYQSSFDDIIQYYTFINDFNQKEPTRDISKGLFWKYNYIIPKLQFHIDTDFSDVKNIMPKIEGSGRPIEHMNKGRIAFLKGDFESARKIFLTGRAKYGDTYKLHRRNDFYIGITYLKITEARLKAAKGNYKDPVVKSSFATAATFLSWAFVLKKDIPDQIVDKYSPSGLLNLASIYYTYDRYALAHSTAELGLHILRIKGLKKGRSTLRRLIAETWVRNRTYLRAVSEIDTMIRQDHVPKDVAAGFARVGDIYFDLNNYELAEDAYALSSAIDKQRKVINPAQHILRGESLFWLGKFSEAQQELTFGIEGENAFQSESKLPDGFAPYAKLRIADAYFARYLKQPKTQAKERNKLFTKAKLEYFRVERNYPRSEAAQIAKIRRACFELPFYKGKNVRHARELLESLKQTTLPAPAIELAWACKVGSYTDRDRNKEMVERVRKFSNQYPRSTFLQSFFEPVREVQASTIDTYIKNKNIYLTIEFFEKNRSTLFPTISKKRQKALFEAYVDSFNSPKAKEFWPTYQKRAMTPTELLRSIVFTTEMQASSKKKSLQKKWKNKSIQLGKILSKKPQQPELNKLNQNFINRILSTPYASQHYGWIYKISKKWSNKSPKYTCQLQYPILAALLKSKKKPSSLLNIKKEIMETVDNKLPGLFEIDQVCGELLINLEKKILKKDPKLYAQRWVQRRDWPIVAETARLFWNAAEYLSKIGDKKSARALWKLLASQPENTIIESKYAKLRLDPNKTEFEGIWQ